MFLLYLKLVVIELGEAHTMRRYVSYCSSVLLESSKKKDSCSSLSACYQNLDHVSSSAYVNMSCNKTGDVSYIWIHYEILSQDKLGNRLYRVIKSS